MLYLVIATKEHEEYKEEANPRSDGKMYGIKWASDLRNKTDLRENKK